MISVAVLSHIYAARRLHIYAARRFCKDLQGPRSVVLHQHGCGIRRTADWRHEDRATPAPTPPRMLRSPGERPPIAHQTAREGLPDIAPKPPPENPARHPEDKPTRNRASR